MELSYRRSLILCLALFFVHSFSIAEEVTITSQPIVTAQVGELYEYDVDAVSSDPNDVILFELKESPSGMTINPSTGLIRWTPTQAGTFEIRVRAQGNSSGSGSGHDDQEFMLTVSNGGGAQGVTIITQPVLTAQVGQLYVYDVDATSSDPNDVITFTLEEQPAGMTINSQTGLIQWIPAMAGLFEVEIRAEGSSSDTEDEQEYTLRVLSGQPAVLRGIVRSQAGEPIPDVRLRLFEISSAHFLFNTRSNSTGHYLFPSVNPGSYFLRIMPPENSVFAPQWYDRVRRIQDATPIIIPETSEIVVNVTLLPRDAVNLQFTISGTVSDTNSAPIRGAKVAIFRARHHDDLDPSGFNFEGLDDSDREQRLVKVVITDSLGNYRALLRPRKYILRASREGFMAQFWDHKNNPLDADRLRLRGDTAGIDFDLMPRPAASGAISGRITGTPTNESVQAHVVGFHRMHPAGGFTGFTRLSQTDSTGRYLLADLRSGFFVVLALPQGEFLPTFYNMTGGTTRLAEAFPVAVNNSTVENVNIHVRPDTVTGMNRVRGVVSASGDPIMGALVCAVSEHNGAVIAAAITGQTGSYTLVGLAPGSYRLEAMKPNYSSGATLPFSLQYAGTLPSTANKNISLVQLPTSTDNVALLLPDEFVLHQNYPNPFNPSTTISFNLSRNSIVRLSIFNLLGQELTTLVEGPLIAGSHAIGWNAAARPSGVYVYRLEVNGAVAARGMILMK